MGGCFMFLHSSSLTVN